MSDSQCVSFSDLGPSSCKRAAQDSRTASTWNPFIILVQAGMVKLANLASVVLLTLS